MNLIDRYVTEIGKRLPRKSRADIEAEIRSTLEDMLEERAEKAGRPADDEMVRELLKEYGAPDKVAATYLPEQYLIGPKLFPVFWLVLKIVGTVLLAVTVIGTGIQIGIDNLNAQQAVTLIAQHALDFLSGIIAAFGNIVLVFAIIERVMPKSKYEDRLHEDWDPVELTREPEPDEIRIWEPIVTIAFTLIALMIFNLYPQIIGFGFLKNGQWISTPVLSDAFFRMLPWLNISWLLGIVLQVLLLRQGKWTPLTRWFDIALRIVSIVISFVLLKGPSLLALSAADMAKVSISAPTATLLVTMINSAITFALIISIIVGGIDVVRSIYKLLIKPAQIRPIAVK